MEVPAIGYGFLASAFAARLLVGFFAMMYFLQI